MQQDENMLLQSMYEDYQAVLCYVAKRSGMPSDEIEDVIQETYISYYQKYRLDWPEKQKKAMLIKIVKHKCIDHYRKNSHYESVSMDDTVNFDETELITKYMMGDSLDAIVRNETYQEVRNCIMEMKKDWRDVAILYFVEERQIKEICDILSLSPTVCRSRISRARKYLKELLRHKYRP